MTASPDYTVTDYLLDRLAQLGADRVFGVPGDFTLGLLDHVEAHPVMSWVGTANELGAGYAADGYARMRGIGVLCTTFGVGELSAINAVAGSFAEHVPVVHIVGAPSRAAQNAGRVVHHSLGDGDFRHFFRMSTEVTACQAVLTPQNAAAEIDRVLLDVRERRLPGYLLLSTDVAEAAAHPPTEALAAELDLTSAVALAAFVSAATELLAEASSVAVLADLLVHRMGATGALHALIVGAAGAEPLPHATLLWGRRVVDESAPGYLGTYSGEASAPSVRSAIEDADALILAGVQFTDLTSGFFSQHLDVSRTVRLDPHRAAVGGVEFSEIELRDALEALAGILEQLGLERASREAVPSRASGAVDAVTLLAPVDAVEVADGDALSQDQLWRIVTAALQPGDPVLADQGTSFYGMGSQKLPRDVVFIGQALWASIGYTLPALLGASLAEPLRRGVLLIGDGAAQLTIAELGTVIRQGLAPIVVVVNNEGYTVERAIHGPTAPFNDIAAYNWTALPAALARDAVGLLTRRARTVGELRTALADARANSGALSLIEVIVGRLDVPPLLTAIAAAAARANAAVSDAGEDHAPYTES